MICGVKDVESSAIVSHATKGSYWHDLTDHLRSLAHMHVHVRCLERHYIHFNQEALLYSYIHKVLSV